MNFKLVLLPFLLLCLFVTDCSHTNKMTQKVATVGVLGSTENSYPNETEYYNKITTLFTRLGAKVVLLDYNKLADTNLQITKKKILSLIKKEHIDHIFIPGDYYNISSEPLRLTNSRQLSVDALSEILNENHKLRSLAICGGLQALMHSKGVEIVRVDSLLHDRNAIESHIISRPNPRSNDAALHKIDISPHSRLATIVAQYAIKKPYNLSIYVADNHVEAISNSQKNLDKLSALGYKVTATSEDGIIEAVEDNYGNIYFQAHPESLAINAEEKYSNADSELRKKSVMASLAIIIDFLH